MKRSLQRNAADPEQVRFAERKAKDEEQLFLASLAAVMGAPAGRVLMWGLLQRAGIYRSVFHDSGSKTYYNAGRQDFGHEVLSLLLEHSPEGYLLMEAEARRRMAATDREAEAVQLAAEEQSNA